jgi:peptidoglycan/xylan/chitin deacetylase (PgdA/CDA1 family)
MAGSFIVSFDCEGNWGVADRQDRIDSRFISRKALTKAYRNLLQMLEAYEMPATFAFVMAFVLRDEELGEWQPRLADVACDGRNWMENFRRAEASRELDGWFCPEALDMVVAAGRHEVGCHGFRHVPFAGAGVTEEVVRVELACAREIASTRGLELRTFVFPRNEVALPTLLAEYGYHGFRNAHPRLGRMGRIGNLLREFDAWERAQAEEAPVSGLICIPGGCFINWQKGLRRLVPRSVSRARWRSIFADAVENDRVAGVFLHPHNLIDGPATLLLLEDILRLAADYREKRGLTVLTQAQYCARRMRSVKPAAEYQMSSLVDGTSA